MTKASTPASAHGIQYCPSCKFISLSFVFPNPAADSFFPFRIFSNVIASDDLNSVKLLYRTILLQTTPQFCSKYAMLVVCSVLAKPRDANGLCPRSNQKAEQDNLIQNLGPATQSRKDRIRSRAKAEKAGTPATENRKSRRIPIVSNKYYLKAYLI